MTAAEYDTLAVKAARLAEGAATHSDASRWWNRSDQYAALADRARTNQED